MSIQKTKRKRNPGVSKAMTQRVIAVYGNECWLKMPGCTRVGTATDHIQPYSLGGPTVLWNLRRACQHCNDLRSNRVVSGIGATLHAVIGPPAGGKTSYVQAHKRLGDIVIDFDQIALSILPDWPKEHDTPQFVQNIVQGMWGVAYRRASSMKQSVDVWLIKSVPATRSSPRLLDEWVSLNYDITVCDPGKATVMDRLKEDKRMATAVQAAKQWYSTGITSDGVALKLSERRAQLAQYGLLATPATPGGSARPQW